MAHSMCRNQPTFLPNQNPPHASTPFHLRRFLAPTTNNQHTSGQLAAMAWRARGRHFQGKEHPDQMEQNRKSRLANTDAWPSGCHTMRLGRSDLYDQRRRNRPSRTLFECDRRKSIVETKGWRGQSGCEVRRRQFGITITIDRR